MPVSLKDYLRGVDDITATAPAYALGHDGSDGLCDCIGLTIGALRRAGGAWTGIRGSNWAARHALITLQPIKSASELLPGACVLKAHEPGDAGYSLPSRYAGEADLRDYYHWGVVRSTNPLRIVHCSSPGVVTDTRLGQWAYHGWLKQVSHSEGDDKPMATTLTVSASSGSTVNLRKTPGGPLLDRIPLGERVTVLRQQDGWTEISYRSRTGWMQSRFLTEDAPSGEASGLADRVDELETRLDDVESRLAALDGGLG